MSPNWLTLTSIGLAVGMVSGLMGIGGGVLLIPLLVFVLGFSQAEAQGTSLGVLALPVVIFAALEYYRQGHVRPAVVGWIVVGFAVGAYAGAVLLAYVPTVGLRIAFGLLLVYSGFTFLLNPERTAKALLPAAVATALGWLFAWFLRRKGVVPPPGAEPDYHI
jgi:hypothetical protein